MLRRYGRGLCNNFLSFNLSCNSSRCKQVKEIIVSYFHRNYCSLLLCSQKDSYWKKREMKAYYAIYRSGIFPSGNLCNIDLSHQRKMSLNLCFDFFLCVCVEFHKQKFSNYILLHYIQVWVENCSLLIFKIMSFEECEIHILL